MLTVTDILLLLILIMVASPHNWSFHVDLSYHHVRETELG
jgi:hypothetical protein